MKKVYGILLNPGPGDFLRFLHGFSELAERSNSQGVILCTLNTWKKCGKLLETVKPTVKIILHDNFSEINMTLKNLQETTIWHCYEIHIIDLITKKLPNEITYGTKHKYAFIDRRTEDNYMSNKIIKHIQVPKLNQNDRGLLFIRTMDIVPERNMNMLIFESILKIFGEKKQKIDIVGAITNKEWERLIDKSNVAHLYLESYPDYYTQMLEYKKYQFAIGMNSGGLDLAIASGVPAIRIGAFHQYYSWLGRNFNDFLSSEPTVNIASLAEDNLTNIGENELRRAYDLLKLKSNENIRWIDI